MYLAFTVEQNIPENLAGLPQWSSGEESACQCRGHAFHPWSRKIPYAVEQLSLCTNHTLWSPRATTAEARVSSARVPQQEKLLQVQVHAPQLEKAGVQPWRPRAAKNK